MREISGYVVPDEECGCIAKSLEETGFFDHDRFMMAMKYCPPSNRKTAIDVGAHVGIWTRAMSNLFDTVYAFEPHPVNFACLIENCPYYNVYNYRIAVTDNGYGRYSCYQDEKRIGNTGARYVLPDEGGDTGAIKLDYFPMMTPISFLKIDVEGAEQLVLRGAATMINTWKPVIFIELKKGFEHRHGSSIPATVAYLDALGYEEKDRIGSDRVFIPK